MKSRGQGLSERHGLLVLVDSKGRDFSQSDLAKTDIAILVIELVVQLLGESTL